MLTSGMRARFCYCALLAVLLIVGSPAQGEAAEIETLSTTPLSQEGIWTGTCTHRLSGEIFPGDAKRLEEELAKLPGQDHDDLNFILCLDSTGGNLTEGLQIGSIIFKNFFGTYVEENRTCLSACAVAFMHGRVGFWEYDANHRMMHPTAVVGFHAPRLEIMTGDAEMVPVPLIDAAYQSAIANIAALTRNAAQSGFVPKIPVIPLTLLSGMLATPADSFLYVDILHKAFMWDIAILPDAIGIEIKPKTDVAQYQLCENATYEIDQSHSLDYVPTAITEQDAAYHQKVGQYTKPDLKPGHTLLVFDGPEERQCSFRYIAEPMPSFEVVRYIEGNSQGTAYVPFVYMLPPATPLKDLPGN